AFWGLQRLYQRTSQFDQALQLTQGLADQWGGVLIGYRLKAEQGSLEVLRGKFAASRPFLKEAVAGLKGQSPPNLVDLPRALLNLAVVELVTDSRAEAEKLGNECRELYRTHRLPEDLLLVEVDNLLGTCAAQNGEYTAAIQHFREGEERCG